MAVRIKIPDIIREECPLPEGWVWQDEDEVYYAQLLKPATDKTIESWFALITHYKEVTYKNSKQKTLPYDNLEDACRLIYAKFLMEGPQS